LLSVRGNDIADLDQAVPLDPVIMGLEGLRSATRWLSMDPNRIRPQDMLAAPGMAFMAAPFIRAARSAPGSAAQAMMRGVTDEDPTVAMPAMRNVTPDNDVAGPRYSAGNARRECNGCDFARRSPASGSKRHGTVSPANRCGTP
jgi:hypothetical protein